ncbi:MAG: glycerol-3-phosphate acyltransferase [Chloroflexota bacterium]
MTIATLLLIFLLGFLIGSIPNAYLVTLAVKRINIFEVGSGNMGGTNVARTLGLHWGIFTAALDALKGILAVVVAQWFVPATLAFSPTMATGLGEALLIPSIVGAVGAVTGHNWSLFATLLYSYYNDTFEIRGGKGAATAFGSMLMILPLVGPVVLLAVGIPVALITRFASLAVLVSFSVCFIWSIVWALTTDLVSNYYLIYVGLLAILIVWRFRENIERLASGTERRLGDRVQTS